MLYMRKENALHRHWALHTQDRHFDFCQLRTKTSDLGIQVFSAEILLMRFFSINLEHKIYICPHEKYF